MSCIALASCCISHLRSGLTSAEPTFLELSEHEPYKKELQKKWQVEGHCSTLLFPSPYPDIKFMTRSCQFNYHLHTTDCYPELEFIGPVRQAYYQVLFRLNQKELQVKNFILPVQLMKLKYIDPFSRQRFIEEISEYLSIQMQLRSVVLEDAGISFFDLCRLLVAIATNSHVKRLYLWNVLSKCDIPFQGPLQSEINLDDMPRIPYTYNPGGRKYLKNLEKVKQSKALNEELEMEFQKRSRCTRAAESIEMSQIVWLENLLNEYKNKLSISNCSAKEQYDELKRLLDEPDKQYGVCMQRSVATQCNSHEGSFSTFTSSSTKTLSNYGRLSEQSTLSNLCIKAKLQYCNKYLKKNENCKKSITVLREIYIFALNGMTSLTTLSVNYCLLADGTGQTLLSIGSLIKGRLLDLELLCTSEELPSAAHEQYNKNALHAIPDVIWKQVKEICPSLKVHLVCVTMSVYYVTSRFITRSIPLNSLHIDNTFCPTLVRPQIMFFSTLKVLHLNFKESFENISIVLWHYSGLIDSSINKMMEELPLLRSFEYVGPLQYKTTISRLCETALSRCKKLINFKLMVQGDPCFHKTSVELTAVLYKKFKLRFYDRSIKFMLGTHNS